MGRWLTRIALRLVPRAWRESVAQDVGEEAGGRRGWWSAAQVLGVAAALHATFTRDAIISDLRYAIRSLLRARWFTVGAILTFALGIGVNVAVFSAVDRMLFAPLPYAHPAALVVMGEFRSGDDRPYGTLPASWVVAARRLPAVSDVATGSWSSDQYRFGADPEGARYLTFAEASYTMLRVLGVRPAVGRDFTDDEARAGDKRLIISDTVWRDDFGARPDIVGQRMWHSFSNAPATIVGVLPAGFMAATPYFGVGSAGLSLDDVTFESAGPTDLSTTPILRLRPGVSPAQAAAQVQVSVAALRAQDAPPPPGRAPTVVRLVGLREAMFGRYTTYLALVFAAATMVLLVGCANLASLLLVRARSRERHVAVQIALGASRRRVVQTAVAEALVLSLLGCAVAVGVLMAANQALLAWLPPIFSTHATPALNVRPLVFSVALAAIGAVAAGAFPGWLASRLDVLAVLQRGDLRAGAGRLRGGSAVLAAEMAVTVVLVGCAMFTGRSLVGLLREDLGFAPDRLDIVSAYLPPSKDAIRQRQQYVDMLDALRSMPAVASAAGADTPPIIGAVNMPMIKGDRRGQRWRVTDGFVETMGMRIVAGRTITPDEFQSVAPVGMLSESGLRLLWPGVPPRDAVGRVMQLPGEPARQVVGIVSDVRGGYAERPWPSLYVPLGPDGLRFMDYVVRIRAGQSLSTDDVIRQLRQAGYAPQGVDASPIEERLTRGVADDRFRAELFSSFGLVALALAVIGVYAVQSFNVAMRRGEMGIRLSLGATRRDLWTLLIRDALRPILVGALAGSALMYWAAQFLQSFLTAVDARGPWAYVGFTCSLLAVAFLAAWIPARRAARTDPAVVLRAQ